MKTCLIGHKKLWAKDIEKRIETAIQTEIENGCTAFTMGTHGDFDHFALSACKRLRKIYKELNIEVVITSLNAIKKSNDEYRDNIYDDVKTVMYDIEESHPKRQITLSNRQMIDECDTLICYVDECEYRSGAKTALRYARKKGLKIVNLFREEDMPYYDMTDEELQTMWKAICEDILAKK